MLLHSGLQPLGGFSHIPATAPAQSTSAIGEMQHSAIAEHACSLQHQINWNGAGVIDHELDWRSRKVKEALHICVEKKQGPRDEQGRWLEVK